jgi:hypothetical protein
MSRFFEVSMKIMRAETVEDRRRRARRLSKLGLAGVAFLVGCFGNRSDGPAKAATSSIWVTKSSSALTVGTATRLREGGIGSLFVPVGALRDGEIEELALHEVPSSLSVTLVLTGNLRGSDALETSAGRAIELLDRQAQKLESAGLFIEGYHLDLDKNSDLTAVAGWLPILRDKLTQKKLYISVSVPREWLSSFEQLQALATHIDYMVLFRYGQRIDEQESSTFWDLAEIERDLRAFDALGIPFQLGIVTLGTASHLSPSGSVKARTTRMSMQELASYPSLRLKPGFSLEGLNRKVYEFIAERRETIGEWTLQKDDSIRIVRMGTAEIDEVARLVQVWQFKNYLGLSLYRAPNELERLSMTPENVVSAMLSMRPELHVDAQPSIQRRTGRGWLVRFQIKNTGDSSTELSFLDNNFCEITLLQGKFGSGVSGQFPRYDLLRANGDGTYQRTFRDPTVLRLYSPVLEAGQELTSGDFEIIGDRSPAFDIGCQFLMPDGRTEALSPRQFRDGKMVASAQDPT